MAQDVFEAEVDRNFDALITMLANLLPHHRGEFALMRAGEVQGYFPNESSALKSGRHQFEDGIFSVQEITDRPADLGFFSHAINPRIA
jgi:hypothetical protein